MCTPRHMRPSCCWPWMQRSLKSSDASWAAGRAGPQAAPTHQQQRPPSSLFTLFAPAPLFFLCLGTQLLPFLSVALQVLLICYQFHCTAQHPCSAPLV